MAINYNDPIIFGSSGTAKSLECAGIDFSESGFESWTEAPVAEIDIALPIARQDVLFEMQSAPFLLEGRVAAQHVFVFMGGFFLGFSVLTAPAVRQFTIARNLISGRSMRLSLVIPTAQSPKSLGISDDLRELGLRLRSIAFKV